jgi:hypothetical protein
MGCVFYVEFFLFLLCFFYKYLLNLFLIVKITFAPFKINYNICRNVNKKRKVFLFLPCKQFLFLYTYFKINFKVYFSKAGILIFILICFLFCHLTSYCEHFLIILFKNFKYLILILKMHYI